MRQTPLQKLVDLKLGGRLQEHVLEQRAAGQDWRSIAADITATTGTSVSYESLRSWFDQGDRALQRGA